LETVFLKKSLGRVLKIDKDFWHFMEFQRFFMISWDSDRTKTGVKQALIRVSLFGDILYEILRKWRIFGNLVRVL